MLREEMRTELKELITRLGITAVFVTHDQTEAMSMSDKIAVLNGGVIKQYGTPEEIYSKPRTPFVAKFIGSSNRIDEHRMFRPENALPTARETAQKFTARVVSVQFLGNTYQVQLKHDDSIWTLPSSDRMQVGTEVSIYINNSDIVSF